MSFNRNVIQRHRNIGGQLNQRTVDANVIAVDRQIIDRQCSCCSPAICDQIPRHAASAGDGMAVAEDCYCVVLSTRK